MSKGLRRRLAALLSRTGGGAAKGPAVSPLAPARFPELPAIPGAAFATCAAGVRSHGRTDVMLARLAPGSRVAGVFTRSATRSAAVRDCEAKLAAPEDEGGGAAILVNAGNANAFTGRAGERTVADITAMAGERLGLSPGRVFTASTGVIGEAMAAERITARLEDLEAGLSEDGLHAAAEAIRTTDTFPKGAGTEIEVDGAQVRIAGIAKGSGMIAPDMATMLAYVFTDATVARPVLQALLAETTEASFNRITVDGDTSTSDTVLLAATGTSSAEEIADTGSTAAAALRQGLIAVAGDLARQIVRDGEGATKFAEIAVTGARSEADAVRVAKAVANSPLVKTALAGEDPNWGRIVMAVGKSGAEADRDRLAIRFGDIRVAEAGEVAAGYDEAAAAAYMRRAELVIGVDLGLGAGAATMWTCDLTHGYIDINADYRS